jgi:predicted AAA+ superfamily ATPase
MATSSCKSRKWVISLKLVNFVFVANSVKQNVIDLRKMIDNTKRLIEDNAKMVEQVKEELARLLEQQLNNITEGFDELMRKLEEKKHEIIFEFEK